jgi:hypothetical protein
VAVRQNYGDPLEKDRRESRRSRSGVVMAAMHDEHVEEIGWSSESTEAGEPMGVACTCVAKRTETQYI